MTPAKMRQERAGGERILNEHKMRRKKRRCERVDEGSIPARESRNGKQLEETKNCNRLRQKMMTDEKQIESIFTR